MKQPTTPMMASPLENPLHRQPCQNGCGFFGSPATKNLCSVCFTDDFHLSTLPRIKVMKTSNNYSSYDEDDHDHKNKRCQYFCDKKVVGLVEFRCRCGGRFCREHQFPEKHACKYDYATAGRHDLIKENPVCKADKLKTRV